MTDSPWQGDACSLIEAFRSGERSPPEEFELCLKAIGNSELNAFSYLDTETAKDRAKQADASKPYGGLPLGVKELENVEGWPSTQASLVFKDRVSEYTSTMMNRLLGAGVVPLGMTTASELGGLNVSISKLNGITGNPWDPTKTAGGSSGGSAAAVAGGLIPLATGGDGGGSIRIPAAFNGLLGMKGTVGRIPRGPHTAIAPLTVVLGCLARSVRDVARYYDVCTGYDLRDPYSLPRVDAWESGLGTHDLKGKRAVIAPTLGSAIVRPEVEAGIVEAGEQLARDAGLRLVDLSVNLPGLGLEWVLSNMASVLVDLGDKYPGCEADLTPEIAFGIDLARGQFNLEMAAVVEKNRTDANETMAAIFDEVDFVISATNPDIAYPAEVTLNTRVGEMVVGPENNGALTIPANIYGNPSVSIPIPTVENLPVGMQVMARHHEDALLLDLTLIVEGERPWPLVAPGSPR
jgi:Asp-tRNA(Asn)/Glu-tRNA(Gln) amidotransferase A subunit family amidase